MLKSNVQYARQVARKLAEALPDVSKSPARNALKNAIMTSDEALTEEVRARLDWILGAKQP